MKFAAATDIGKVRQTNEDAFFVSENGTVFVVADGMGGHHCGEVASNLAITTVEKYSATLSECPEEDIADNFNQIAHDVFFLISAKVSEDDSCAKMGTTIVIAVIRNNKLYYAHLGDSRLYLLRNKILSRVTHDHSVVQELIDAKVITEIDALTHPMKNMVTRVLADGSDYTPETGNIDLYNGDKILLCTDGLCGIVDDNIIESELKKDFNTHEIDKLLINTALDAGGNDNITVIVIQNKSDYATIINKPVDEKKVNHWKNGFIALFTALMLFLVIYFTSGYLYKKFIVKINPTTKTLAIFEYRPLIPFLSNRIILESNINENDLNKIDDFPHINFIQGKTVDSVDDGKAFLNKLEESINSTDNKIEIDKENKLGEKPSTETNKK